MSTRYKIIVCSLPDYEDLVAEMYIEGEFIGLLSQEEGRGKFVLELNSPLVTSSFPLTDFLEILNDAYHRLSAVG